MKIHKVALLGLGTEFQNLFSNAGLKVLMLDVLGDDTQELPDTDLILENLLGDVELKRGIFSKCEEKASHEAIFATTASSGITELAAASKRPQRFVGLNFTINPFTGKYLVQIAKGLETSDETVAACRELMDEIGITAVELEDSPGLILNRVLATVINEAAFIYSSKLASINDIDKIMKLSANWPMGPFEFADTIGADEVLATLEVLSQQEGSQYLPCRLLRQMVAMGWLGKKTGKGFYTYG